ncbi:hypothetical protein K493DRAFT_18714 [Basidiobolus meristosporus CBS 931.73]|uniref:Uncharacterized protein n=1 Tax=Basidiobolus meristosporus CBS 931.73 TaxID=1314790 RepID=A0A1Y1Z9C8_9FUNG|nr:hypothetical protein K493DRAFT_18714 [Basidiobolus meristosporus CBS 931.73]|eukprot:ORY06627.1 hypothetical protein K493DRAFT_18714 [Basidiobolus meristosporus CBS 931.73]
MEVDTLALPCRSRHVRKESPKRFSWNTKTRSPSHWQPPIVRLIRYSLSSTPACRRSCYASSPGKFPLPTERISFM